LKDQGLQTKVAQPANAVGQNNCNLAAVAEKAPKGAKMMDKTAGAADSGAKGAEALTLSKSDG